MTLKSIFSKIDHSSVALLLEKKVMVVGYQLIYFLFFKVDYLYRLCEDQNIGDFF